MIKLIPNVESERAVFYFHTLSECKEFIYVFEDHWCNVPWKDPVESADFPEMTLRDRELMNIPPKQRADAYFSWGFRLCRRNGLDNLTESQQAFVNTFIKNITTPTNGETVR